MLKNPQPASQSSAQRWLLWLALASAVLWLSLLGTRKLVDPDEGRYAEIPREMVASGDWLTPRLNDLHYFEKPPLQYWATAAAYEVFGTTEFASRLWCGLTALTGVLFCGWLGARLFGRSAGVIAATLLAGSLMYFLLGQINTLDMGLTFFLTVAIGGFMVAQHTPPKSKTERNYMLLAWAAAALAVLSKGIVAIALPAMTLVVYTVVQREYSAWRRLHVPLGLAVFLLIAAPWFIAVSMTNPGFAKFFFLHEHFQRFLTDVHHRVEAWWFFIPFLLIGALPWTSLAVVAVAKAWRGNARSATEDSPSNFHTRRFLVIWFVVSMVFFSASQSKLVPYILPVFPALALLVGDYVARIASNTLRNHVAGVAVLWAVALGYLIVVLVWGPLPQKRGIPPELFAEVLRWAAAAAAIAFTSAAASWVLAGRGRTSAAILGLSGGTFVALSILTLQLDAVRTIRSGYDLAQVIKPYQTANQDFYSVGTYDHSLAFYLGRNLTVADYSGELEFGQSQEPDKSLASLAAFKQAWAHSPSGSLAVMPHAVFEALTSDALPMQNIGRSFELTAVKKQ